jgi:hypothetical protein
VTGCRPGFRTQAENPRPSDGAIIRDPAFVIAQFAAHGLPDTCHNPYATISPLPENLWQRWFILRAAPAENRPFRFKLRNGSADAARLAAT